MKPFEDVRITVRRRQDFMEVSAVSEGTHRLIADKMFVSETSPALVIEISSTGIEFRLKTEK